MSLSRNSLLALLSLVALIAFGLAWTHLDLNRDGDMRAAEDDFYERLKSKPSRASSPFAADYRPDQTRPAKSAEPAQSAASLDAWYAESASAPDAAAPPAEGTGASGDEGSAPAG